MSTGASTPRGTRGTPGRPGGFVARWRLGTRCFLAAVWVMLWRDVSLGNVIAGLLLASLIMALMPFPPAVFGLRLRPWPFLVLIARFIADLVVASLQVAYTSVAPWRHPVGRFARVRLRATHDLPRTLTAGLTSLVPGSLVVDLEPDTGVLTLHLFDVPTQADVEAAVAGVRAQERRVLRALFAEPIEQNESNEPTEPEDASIVDRSKRSAPAAQPAVPAPAGPDTAGEVT